MERQIPENVYLTRGLNVYTHIHKNINHKDTNHLYKDPTKVIVSTAAERRTDNEVSCKLRPLNLTQVIVLSANAASSPPDFPRRKGCSSLSHEPQEDTQCC